LQLVSSLNIFTYVRAMRSFFMNLN